MNFFLYAARNLAVTVFLIFSVIIFAVRYSSSGLVYDNADTVPGTDAALILGAGIKNDAPLEYLKDRLDSGIELYEKGKVKTLIISGDDGNNNYDEVSVMYVYLTEAGIPEEKIITDDSGYNTYSSLYRVKNSLKINDITVVTQEYHLPRTIFIARKLGLTCYGLAADRSQYAPKRFKFNRIREYPATIKACFNVLFSRNPLEYKA